MDSNRDVSLVPEEFDDVEFEDVEFEDLRILELRIKDVNVGRKRKCRAKKDDRRVVKAGRQSEEKIRGQRGEAYYDKLLSECKFVAQGKEEEESVEPAVEYEVKYDYVVGGYVEESELIRDLFDDLGNLEKIGCEGDIVRRQVCCDGEEMLCLESSEGLKELIKRKVHWFGVGEVKSEDILRFLGLMSLYVDERPDVQYAAFVTRAGDAVLYGVFNRSTQKLDFVRLKVPFATAVCYDMLKQQLDCGWFALNVRMLESTFVAQSAQVEIVHWSDKRLPEFRFVLQDPEVSSEFLEEWQQTGAWKNVPGKTLANSLPAIAHIEANYCEVCGGVDMCRHLLAEIVGNRILDVELQMNLAMYGVYDVLRLRSNPGLISLSSPHIRYALARTLCAEYSNVKLVHWKSACETMCYDFYAHRIVAQTLVSDAFAQLEAAFSTLWDLFMYVPRNVGNVVGDWLLWMLRSVRQYLEAGLVGLVDAVFSQVLAKMQEKFGAVYERFKPLALAILKVIIRVALGYTPVAILMEMVWDSVILKEAVTLCKALMPAIVPQGVEDFGAIVGALGVGLFVGLGKAMPSFKLMSEILSAMILSAGAFNRAQLWDQFKALQKWYDGSDERAARIEMLRLQFPDSVRMMELYEMIVAVSVKDESTVSLRTELGFAYAGYLRERKKFGSWSRDISELLAPALRYVQTHDISGAQSVRRRPAVALFFGPSNIGKSRLVLRVSELIAGRHKENYSQNGRYSAANAIFNVNVGDEFASGYDNQDIWVFDEWLQEKDSEAKPSKSVSLLFTLVSTAVNRLNMAGVDDKGKPARVSLVLGATNVELNDGTMDRVVKSIHTPSAVHTRIKYRVRPVLQPGFAMHEKRMCRVHKTENGDVFESIEGDCVPESELYEFEVSTYGDRVLKGDLVGGRFSWGALLALLDSEYVQSREFEPPEVEEVKFEEFKFDAHGNVLPVSKEDGKAEIVAQGLKDWIPVSWLWEKTTDYYTEDGVKVEGKVVETYEDGPDVFRAFRVDPEVADVVDFSVPRVGAVSGPEREVLRGIFVKVKKEIAPDIKTVGFGLLLLVVGVVALVPLTKKVVKVGKEIADFTEVIVDGISCRYYGETQCVTAQGQLVTIDGRPYMRVKTKDGYKNYAQGVDDRMLELIGNQRTKQQLPVLYDAVFAVVNNQRLIGNAFALTDSRFILPLHVAKTVYAKGAEFFNGKIKLTLIGECGKVRGYYIQELTDDVAILCLEAYKLNGIRNNFTKLVKKSPSCGLVRQIVRNASAEMEVVDGDFIAADQDIEYMSNGVEYCVPRKYARSTSCPGYAGMCGGIYVNLNEVNADPLVGGIVLGMHIAADETKGRRVFRVFDGLVFTLTSIFETHYPPLEGVKDGLGAVFGWESAESNYGSKIHSPGRLGKTTVPSCIGAEEYDVAHLLPFEKNGEEVDIVYNGLKNLREFSKRDVLIPEKVEKVVDFLCEYLSREAIICNPDWIETFSGAGLLPSITRKTAVGTPLNSLGPTKEVLCMTPEELAQCGLQDAPVPNTATLRMLDDLVDRIKSGQTFESACSVSTKEEARLAGKVLEGNTRLFAGAPGHEFLLQRRYFMGVLATFLHKNLAVGSALGIDPDRFKEMHDMLVSGFKNPAILTADYNKMDQCFTPVFISFIARIIRSIALGRPVGKEYVSEEDYIRAVLIMRLAFNRLLVGKEIVEPKGGHPSGSCLTTIFNIIADLIVFVYGFWEMMGGDLEAVMKLVRMVFLGDDSVVCAENGSRLNLAVLQKAAEDCGFKLTGADKLSGLQWMTPYDYKSMRSAYAFLGRYFTKGAGVLDIHRLSKMPQFCEQRRFLEVMPQLIISHREEVARYYATGQVDWLEAVMPQVKHFGFSTVEDYVGCSIPDLQQTFLQTLSTDHSRMAVTVPHYNRYKAQGHEDGEPSSRENLGDAEFVSNVPSNEIDTDAVQSDYLQDHMDPVNYASSEIFSRAYAVVSGSTGIASDAMLTQLTAASSYFYKNFNAQAKLANCVYMRCKFKAKVIVASGPFVTGKLLLTFLPGNGAPNGVIQASGCPCTEVDLSSARSAVIEFDTTLPEIWMLVEKFSNPASPASFNFGFDYGTVTLWTLTPISESVVYTIYVWLEDVQLRGVGFTNFTLTPQGRDKRGKEPINDKTDKFHHVSKDYGGELEMMKWKWRVENTPQWLNTTAASVETTAGCVETIETSILGPVGDFMEKVEGGLTAAAMFGACAPNPNPHFTCFMQAPNWAQSQMICPVPGVRLAVVQTQKSVLPRTLFGNRGDEMNIHEYTSRMCVLARIPWNGLDASGHTLAVWNVMPGVLPPAPIIDGQFSTYPTALGFVAGTFRLWRGSIRYRLSVAKTAFHTGTLEVVWQMGLCLATPSTPGQDALTQRYIWDVTQSSTIEFEVPYVAQTAFTQVYFTVFGSTVSASDLTTGRLYLNVINPLASSNGTVPSNIDIVLYVGGGSDIEFAMPGKQAQIDAGSSGLDRRLVKKRRFVPQGGPFGSDSTSDGLGTKVMERLRNVPYPSLWAHMTTTGERVLSLRMVIKRFSQGTPIPSSMTFNHALINSWFMLYCAAGYYFWTGSWRVQLSITSTDFESATVPLNWQLVWNSTYAGPGVQAGEAHMTIAPWSNATVLEVPWYNVTPFKVIGQDSTCGLEGPSPATSLAEYAAGDDFAYGFQIGPNQINYFVALPDPLY